MSTKPNQILTKTKLCFSNKPDNQRGWLILKYCIFKVSFTFKPLVKSTNINGHFPLVISRYDKSKPLGKGGHQDLRSVFEI